MTEIPEVDHSRGPALAFFRSYTQQHKTAFQNKIVCDLSAGRGYIANLFEQAGAVVKAFDLFPNQNKFAKSTVQKIDLQQKFPIDRCFCRSCYLLRNHRASAQSIFLISGGLQNY